MPYRLSFINVTCSSENKQFATREAAIAAGRKAGFEFAVWRDDKLIASWTVFGGLRAA